MTRKISIFKVVRADGSTTRYEVPQGSIDSGDWKKVCEMEEARGNKPSKRPIKVEYR